MTSSQPHTRASAPETLDGSAITKVTLYQYTGIALAILYHLLDDHPRHIRYRETHGKRPHTKPHQDTATADAKRSRNSRSPLPPVRSNRARDYRLTDPRDTRPAAPPRPSQQDFYSGHPTRPGTQRYDSATGEDVHASRGQKSQAWMHMKSVTPGT
jgi:hypothetical protein